MRFPWWIWLLAVLLVAGYALPYTLFAGVEAWTGSLLFWILFGVAVWAVLVAAASRWNVDAEEADGAPGETRGGER